MPPYLVIGMRRAEGEVLWCWCCVVVERIEMLGDESEWLM